MKDMKCNSAVMTSIFLAFDVLVRIVSVASFNNLTGSIFGLYVL